MNKIIHIVVFILIVINLSGCNELIEYSPYDTNIVSKNINLTNTVFDNTAFLTEDTLKFVLIADPHISYDDLKDAIKKINVEEDIKFIICCGDITDCGLSQEFLWYSRIIEKSKYPVITVIGNHDYRSNGRVIYERMFGPVNMTFKCMGYNFIMFDDVVWENKNRSPQFDWLGEELEKCDQPTVLLAHIPPWTDQLEGEYSQTFEDLLSESSVILTLHGHLHSFSEESFAGIPVVVSGCIAKRGYNIIKVYGQEHSVEHVTF